MPVEYENDNNTEWINSVESMQIVTAPIESLSMPDTVAATLTIAPNNLNNISDTNHTASVDTESSDNVIITMPTDALSEFFTLGQNSKILLNLNRLFIISRYCH